MATATASGVDELHSGREEDGAEEGKRSGERAASEGENRGVEGSAWRPRVPPAASR